jgi:hypothetical protein
MNLYEAQWLAYLLSYRRFAAVLTDCNARLGADTDRYSFIVSDLHRLSLPVSRRTAKDSVRHLSRRMRSSGLLVRIRRQCSSGKA